MDLEENHIKAAPITKEILEKIWDMEKADYLIKMGVFMKEILLKGCHMGKLPNHLSLKMKKWNI